MRVQEGRDNFASFAGMYGLGNPMVLWLIACGFGELVALTPQEMRVSSSAPHCPDPKHFGYDQPLMLWRGLEWVCYEHDVPVRQRILPRLQQIPTPPFSWQEVIGKEVDLAYTREDDERYATWKYVVDGQMQRTRR